MSVADIGFFSLFALYLTGMNPTSIENTETLGQKLKKHRVSHLISPEILPVNPSLDLSVTFPNQ